MAILSRKFDDPSACATDREAHFTAHICAHENRSSEAQTASHVQTEFVHEELALLRDERAFFRAPEGAQFSSA